MVTDQHGVPNNMLKGKNQEKHHGLQPQMFMDGLKQEQHVNQACEIKRFLIIKQRLKDKSQSSLLVI
jgi:hypothetical protein